MPYRKVYFSTHNPVHIISRALIDIFKQKEDCYRFIFQFYATNVGKSNTNIDIKDKAKVGQALLYGEKISSKFITNEHPPLVNLLDFSFVVNHDHFCLLPAVENVIPLFMRRLNSGIAQFFNLRHQRKDAVFGRRYKSVIVETDLQSHAVSRYVSVINPLDVFQPGWREKGLNNPEAAFDFLESYEFSSFPDKIGKRNSAILAPKEILEQYAPFWGNGDEYRKFVKEFLKERSNSSRPLFIE